MYQDDPNKIIKISLSITMIIFMLIFFVISFFKIEAKEKELTTTRTNIASVNISSEVNGSFSIGCGQVNEEKYYVYYELYSDGGKELKQVKAANVKIYDTLPISEQPYLIVVTNGLGFTVSSEFHLPIGAVTTTYDLNVSKIQ